MNILHEICVAKKSHVEARKKKFPLYDLENQLRDLPPTRNFSKALNTRQESGKPGIIAEIKRRSPSAGKILEPGQRCEDIAKAYERSGASCLSVLTDTPYFGGKDEDIRNVKNACDLPVLRKDFIIDTYQITESRVLGADCILLIMSVLDDFQAKEFFLIANDLDLDVLIEVHDTHELKRALKLHPELLGVNNRDLKRQVTDLSISETLAKLIPDTCIKVSESGINDPKIVRNLMGQGYDAFLIGEYFLNQRSIEKAVKKFSTIN